MKRYITAVRHFSKSVTNLNMIGSSLIDYTAGLMFQSITANY